ncbi:hypothetical protein [Thermomonas sp.]|uniref:hypothetical protein n=1 Tax=Thermomonas sp. TaxID=1971895 RepID=UPI00260F38EC|nr:hypothetical protein [Thermomonas sp.]
MRLIAILILLALTALVLYAIYLGRTRGLPPSVRAMLTSTFGEHGWLARLWPLWLGFIATFGVVAWQNPMKGWLVLYAISKILLGGLVGLVIHWGFRRIHPLPAEPTGIETGTDWKCAAWIICAAEIALALVP